MIRIIQKPRLAYVALTRTKKTMFPLVTSKGYLPVRYDDNNMLINKFDKIFHKTLYFYAD